MNSYPPESPGPHTTSGQPPNGAAVRLRERGFAFEDLAGIISCQCLSSAWRHFSAAWDRLPVDAYLHDGQLFRRRRYGRFRFSSNGGLEDRQHGPYYQSSAHNTYAGGIHRQYAEIEAGIRQNDVFRELIMVDALVISEAIGHYQAWNVEVHMFRITACASLPATPTPEGIHRDGNDAFAVHLVKYACRGGTTRIYTTGGRILEDHTLRNQAETLYVNDTAVLHDVSHIRASSSGMTGLRDVMVVDFTAN